jgi:GNAT superfamily N-acetyltransferase
MTTHALTDGTQVSIRALRPEDREGLHDAFKKLSAASRYSRFLRPMGDLSPDLLDYLTRVDGKNHVALVATRESLDLKDESGVAVGRFISLPDRKRCAEVAITVADACQGRGLGTLMLRALADEARRVDVDTFVAEMLGDHRAIPRLVKSGAKVVGREPGAVLVELPVASIASL